MSQLLIVIFFGWTGAHKFMNGKFGIGILYLFTMGLFGIGWFIDIIIALVNISNGPPRSTQPPTPIPKTNQDVPENNPNIIRFSVAGVTFKNEDGTSRQDILQKFYLNRGYSRHDIELQPYKLNEEDAIAVYAKGKMIGNVPHEFISPILKYLDTVTVHHFRVSINHANIFYSTIDLLLPVPPSTPAQNANYNGSEDDPNLIHFSVAGVTFKNEDGTSRQDILQKFYLNRGYSRRDIELRPYKFNEGDAIAVYAKGKMIGNVPHEFVSPILKYLDTVTICHFRVNINNANIFYAIVDLLLQ